MQDGLSTDLLLRCPAIPGFDDDLLVSRLMAISIHAVGVVHPVNVLARFATSDGQPFEVGVNEIDAVGNYSATPTPFWIESERPIIMARMILLLSDDGPLGAGEYGNLGAPLANGINMDIVDLDDVVVGGAFLGAPVTTNAEWAQYFYDIQTLDFGAGANYLVGRFSFFTLSGSRGTGVYLPPGFKFRVVFNDDLTGLVQHRFLIEGQYARETI